MKCHASFYPVFITPPAGDRRIHTEVLQNLNRKSWKDFRAICSGLSAKAREGRAPLSGGGSPTAWEPPGRGAGAGCSARARPRLLARRPPPPRRPAPRAPGAGLVASSPENPKVITQVLSFRSLGLFGLDENFENQLKL